MVEHVRHIFDVRDIEIRQIAIEGPSIEEHPTHIHAIGRYPSAQISVETVGVNTKENAHEK
jgi:hypothetical protein